MLRWGILSTGTIAKKFAETLSQMKGEAILAAVASRNIEKAEVFANEHRAGAYFGSYKELADSEDIDAVYVATPNRFHFEHSMMCLNTGKHVLCEKPFTTNANHARELYAAARSKGLFIMDAIKNMHLPIYQKLRQLLDNGVIGDVRHIRADYGFSSTGARKDFKLDSAMGGGALLDVGVYNISFAAMIMGGNPSGIKAQLNISGSGTDDFSNVILEYSNQRSASLSSSIGVVLPAESRYLRYKGQDTHS